MQNLSLLSAGLRGVLYFCSVFLCFRYLYMWICALV
uniref:Uncharacterized protein n=1 Tax=Rhizophora mucronata TaxID=61149 RepID=A0A2P2QAT9_RHIMU